MEFSTPPPPSAEVLVVNDDAVDASLLRIAFKRAPHGSRATLHMVGNGRECLAFLRKTAPYENAPWPDLVLLDVNMPVMDGRQTLEALAADPALRSLPAVVLTSSANSRDILDMYALGCRTYVVAPTDYDDFQAAVELICRYWLTLAARPTAPR